MKMTVQQKIFEMVQARGYIDEVVWFALYQQTLKMLEEATELAFGLQGLRPRDADAIYSLHQRARKMFDESQTSVVPKDVDTAVLIAELADVAVVAFVMAELLGVDLQAVAVEKAERDVKRGKRA